MRWFTSDTHFFHKNIIDYDMRPFSNVDEMQECIIRNWNNTVSKKDIVYHLGDFAFGNPKRWKAITDRLNGNITLVRGNHDLQNGATLKRLVVDGLPVFNDICDFDIIPIGGRKVVLCHYPYKRNDGDFRLVEYRPNNTGLWLIHGHTHNLSPKVEGRMINVGCMLWDYFPVSENQISHIIKENDGII